jgi:hypothetical protein
METVKQHKIEAVELHDTDKEQIAKLRETIKDARYIMHKYGKEHPQDAFECLEKILDSRTIRHKGGTH